MSSFSDTRVHDGDTPPVTYKKILQRLNTDADLKLVQPGTTSNNPVYIDGTLPHDNPIVEGRNALVTRPAGSFRMDVARGLHPEHSDEHKFGYNAAIPNGSFADVYTYGASVAVYPWPTAALPMRIRVGGNGADDSSGAGARSIMVQGLDTNFQPIEEVIVTKGALVSDSTSQSFRRVYRAFVVDTGAYGVGNTGAILVENTSGAVLAHIPVGIGQTQQTHYTVPAGKTAYISHVHAQVAVGTNKDADVRMFQRLNADIIAAPFGAKRLVTQYIGLQGNGGHLPINSFVAFAAKTDIWFDAQGNGAVTGVNVSYDLALI
jgi:hypothetical protein